MSSFNVLFQQIFEINKIDKTNHSERLCKLMEEVGELVQAVNKLTGRKKRTELDTEEAIVNNITEEIADVIQNAICIGCGFGIDREKILEIMSEKNKKWQNIVNSK